MIKSILTYILNFTLEFIKISFEGWIYIARDTKKIISYFLRGVSLYQYIFIFFCASASAAALIPWLYYEVDFLGREEVYIGSNYKMIFVLPLPAGLSLLFIPTSKKRKIFYVFFSFIVIPYLAGLFFANPIHTKMTNPNDYKILPVMYIFGALLIPVGISAYKALEKNAIDYSWLFSPLKQSSISEKSENVNFDSIKSVHPLKNIIKNKMNRNKQSTHKNSQSAKITEKPSKKNLNIKIVR